LQKLTKIRVLIVDDHAVLRAGLRMLIDSQKDMTAVGEAADGDEGVLQAVALRPDVVLMDITLPERGGLMVTEQIVEKCPGIRVLALTMHEDEAFVRGMLAAGAMGYVVKRSADLELLDAIRTVFRGKRFVDSRLSGAMLYEMFAVKGKQPGPEAMLSGRERTVLVMIAQGYTNSETADRLKLSIKTIETYRTRISEKLGIRSRPELVHFAIECGLLTPESFVPEVLNRSEHKK